MSRYIKPIVPLWLMLLSTFSMQAQSTSPEAVNAAGTTLTGTTLQMDMSIGEFATTTLSSSELIATQGLLQGEEDDECPGYVLDLQEVACTSSQFSLPLIINEPIKAGVIGLDFSFTYDNTVMQPSGTATLGEVVHGGDEALADYYLNTATPGVVTGIIYFSSAAPFGTDFSGSGMIIEVDFQLYGVSPGDELSFEITQLRENSLLGGAVELCEIDPFVVEVGKEKVLSGLVYYQNTTWKAMKYDEINTSNFLPTIIEEKDASCMPTGNVLFTNIQGIFELDYSDDATKTYSISRDIPGSFSDATGCTNVMPWINGVDRSDMEKIATADPYFTPSIYALMAADVNQDGVVSSADITLLNQRSVMAICGFPTVVNGAIVDGKDWLFVQKTELDENPAYAISATFPSWDGVGANKDHVPSGQDCMTIPADDNPLNCYSSLSEEHSGILLGDVNGSWSPDNGGSTAKKAPTEYVLLDVNNGAENPDGSLSVPIKINADTPINAFDFYFTSTNWEVDGVELTVSNGHEVHNEREDLFLFSSYSEGVYDKSNVGQITMYSSAEENLVGDAFINGKQVPLLTQLPNTSIAVMLYPNPFSETLTLEINDISLKESVAVTVYNELGVEVFANAFTAEENYLIKDINLTGIAQGVYFVKVAAEDVVEVIKVIKSK